MTGAPDTRPGLNRLPALTIWQPWASLIIAGAKPYEFRGWPAPKWVRGMRIAIHAGSRKVVLAEMRALRLKLNSRDDDTGLVREIALPLIERWCQDPAALPLASILGTALLGEPLRASDIPEYAHRFVNDSDRHEHANWGWPLSDIEPLAPVVPAKGAQGFWWWQPPAAADHPFSEAFDLEHRSQAP